MLSLPLFTQLGLCQDTMSGKDTVSGEDTNGGHLPAGTGFPSANEEKLQLPELLINDILIISRFASPCHLKLSIFACFV